MWQDFLAALALVFVIEGILPFMNPDGYKRMMSGIQSMDAKSLRTMGLTSMMIGLIVLYLVR